MITVMSEPIFEFSCSGGNGAQRVFTIKNVSTVIFSKIVPLSFDLICIDHTSESVLPFEFQFPTSLVSGQEQSFEISNSKFKYRNVGDKEFKFVFTVEDDNSNIFRCSAEKNVEDPRNINFIAGKWEVNVLSIGPRESYELFKNLLSKDIYSILDGDNSYGSYNSRNGRVVDIGLPYLSGPVLCDISTRFGLPVKYNWGGSNLSRWSYVEDILRYCIEKKTISDLLSYLFAHSQFLERLKGFDYDEIEDVYKQSVNAAIKDINNKLLFSRTKLTYKNKHFVVEPTNDPIQTDDELLEKTFVECKHESSSLEGYRQCELIGKGGFGEVYRYHHLYTDRDFAVKIYYPVFLTDEKDKELGEKRFFREARMLYDLNHPNIVRIYDSGWINGNPFIRMDLLNGRNLIGFHEDKGNLKPRDALKAIRQILRGLGYAHAKGIIHRDLKPSNVIVCETDSKLQCVIIDFGISAFMETEGYTRLTRTGEQIAGGYYTDPELINNPKLRDPRSDIYSVGAILYFLLCGRTIGGADSNEVLISSNQYVDEKVISILSKSISSDIDKRYSSCENFINDINLVVGAES